MFGVATLWLYLVSYAGIARRFALDTSAGIRRDLATRGDYDGARYRLHLPTPDATPDRLPITYSTCLMTQPLAEYHNPGRCNDCQRPTCDFCDDNQGYCLDCTPHPEQPPEHPPQPDYARHAPLLKHPSPNHKVCGTKPAKGWPPQSAILAHSTNLQFLQIPTGGQSAIIDFLHLTENLPCAQSCIRNRPMPLTGSPIRSAKPTPSAPPPDTGAAAMTPSTSRFRPGYPPPQTAHGRLPHTNQPTAGGRRRIRKDRNLQLLHIRPSPHLPHERQGSMESI
jgi:hypothetical protein